MKHTLLLIFLLCAMTLQAQVLVKHDYPVSGLEKGSAFHPVFSPDGNQLLITSANYTGLDLYDISTKSVQHITDDAGAGFKASFSEDGKTVYFKQTETKNGLQFKTLKSYDEKKQTVTKLSEPMRPQEEQSTQLRSAVAGDKTVACSEKLKLVVYRNGQRTELSPVGEVPGYVWVSLSPDGKKILFAAATKGTFVCDLSGKIIASLGKLNAPVWFGNQHVVGMDDKDNGEITVSSRIIIASLDGKLRQALTQDDKIAMYPAASAASQRIAYCTDQGEVRIMEIDMNQ